MSDFHTRSTHTARKLHKCGRVDLIEEIKEYEHNLSLEDKAAVNAARAKGFTIQPGEKYVKCVGVFDGEFYVDKFIPEILDIFDRNEVWDE